MFSFINLVANLLPDLKAAANASINGFKKLNIISTPFTIGCNHPKYDLKSVNFPTMSVIKLEEKVFDIKSLITSGPNDFNFYKI